MQPVNVRLPDDQIAWLDSQRQDPFVTRSEVLRHVVADSMARDRQRLKAARRRLAQAQPAGIAG